ITAQSQVPNARANVASSVPLGATEAPGCVCSQIRAKRFGGTPALARSSNRSATASSSKMTVASVQRWRTTRMSSTRSRSSAWERPKPPTSVGPAWQRYCSLSQASGAKVSARPAMPSPRAGGSDRGRFRMVMVVLLGLAGGAKTVGIEVVLRDALRTADARGEARRADGTIAVDVFERAPAMAGTANVAGRQAVAAAGLVAPFAAFRTFVA